MFLNYCFDYIKYLYYQSYIYLSFFFLFFFYKQQTQTLFGIPTLFRIRQSSINADAIVWNHNDDERNLPLYREPQENPQWEEVESTHERNRAAIIEAVSIRKSTTAKFSKAVASKYHQHYLEWQERYVCFLIYYFDYHESINIYTVNLTYSILSFCFSLIFITKHTD